MSPPSPPTNDAFVRAAFQLYPLLVGGLLHDVNNSLTFLSGTVELAHLGHDDVLLRVVKDGTFAARIQHVARVTQVIHQLSRRFYARDGRNRAPREEIEELLAEQVKQHPKVKLEPRIECAPEQLNLPSGLLTFLLSEVLKNAAQATREQPDAQISIALSISPEQSTFLLECRDNGIGFTPEHLKKIRADEWRLPRNLDQGGLGLYLMHEIIVRLGGQLQISNLEPRGARVAVLLPLRQESTS